MSFQRHNGSSYVCLFACLFVSFFFVLLFVFLFVCLFVFLFCVKRSVSKRVNITNNTDQKFWFDSSKKYTKNCGRANGTISLGHLSVNDPSPSWDFNTYQNREAVIFVAKWVFGINALTTLLALIWYKNQREVCTPLYVWDMITFLMRSPAVSPWGFLWSVLLRNRRLKGHNCRNERVGAFQIPTITSIGWKHLWKLPVELNWNHISVTIARGVNRLTSHICFNSMGSETDTTYM